MRLTASDIVTLYRPTECSLRVYLLDQGVPEAEKSEFEKIIEELGRRHEKDHLKSLGSYEDISSIERDQQVTKTLEAIKNRVPLIYQGEFATEATIGGVPVIIVGRPDFLILDGDGYIVRDSKISRKVDEKHHEEITLQLQLYGWLFERMVGTPPKSLQVHTGTGELVDVPNDGGVAALSKLVEILALKQLKVVPYEPAGWSKCKTGCGFRDRCWSQAEAQRDVSVVSGIDQGLAQQLHADGIKTMQELVAKFDAPTLGELKRPYGTVLRRVGKSAERILLNAEALISGKERILGPVGIPEHDSYAMFDLEGMPPELEELEKVYLWGMQVFGKKPGKFIGATAGFGSDGDREGWERFLKSANEIFTEYGDIPFVHWHHYERTHIKQYIDRYGDPNGVAQRVIQNLIDLLPKTRDAIVLPIASFSLKEVEKYIGFKRTQDEYGGSWAMAQFILATETNDEAERNARMSEILKYNEEDLAATWAVFEWLRKK